MDTRAQKPTLSVGNQIYLYRLLSESIGCGRQTIMGKVEEALAADRMGAEDLGFESTRALLEALDAFVALTVFKGGRIYATVTAQPAWDEALAAPEKQAAPAGKSWKRKKADKSLKPVRPRRVKRAVEAEPEAEAPDRDGAAGDADAGAAVKDAPGGAAGGSPAPTEAAPDKAAPAAEGPSQPRAAETAASPSEPAGERGPARDEATGGTEPAAQQVASPKTASPKAASPEAASPVSDKDTAQADGAGSAADGEAPSSEDAASPAEPAREPAAQPAISLTVVYDPENANAGVTTLESTPDAGGRAAASEAASPDADATDVTSPDADATDVASSEPETPEADSPARTEASPSPAGADGAKPRAARPPRAPRNRTDRAGARTGRSAADDAGSRIRGDRGAGTAPVPSEPRPLPEGYPADLTRDVYCPGPVLHELALLLPLGADALGILDAYYRIAQLLGTLEAGRNRASFPLGYLRDGERLTATVRLRRKRGDAGAAWVVDAVEAPTDSTADGR